MRSLLLFFSLLLALSEGDVYDEACDAIVEAAQQAGAAINAKNIPLFESLKTETARRFEHAISLDKNHPQAYLHFATFLQNGQEYTHAIEIYDIALKGLESKDAIRHVVNKRDECSFLSELKNVSVLRDSVYNLGQGDIPRAFELVKKQLRLMPAPHYYHDKAIMEVMQNIMNPLTSFQSSIDMTILGAVAFFNAARRPKCDNIRVVQLQDSKRMNKVHTISARLYQSSEFVSSDVTVFKIRKAIVCGKDAVIVALWPGNTTDSRTCVVFSSSNWPFIPLHENLYTLQIWNQYQSRELFSQFLNGPPPKPNGRAASFRKISDSVAILSGFASTDFYHWLLEGLPRLIALRSILDSNPEIKILLPSSSKPYIDGFLELLMPLLKTRVIRLSSGAAIGEQLQVENAFVVDWKVSRKSNMTHCLAPKVLLNELRRQSWAALGINGKKNDADFLVVLCMRVGVAMRNLKDGLKLKNALEELENIRVVIFDGSLNSKESVKLFANANVIIGVHGGALSNAVFTKPSSLLLELGFNSPWTAHYEHLAAAQDLKYKRYLLASLPQGPAANTVMLDSSIETIRDIQLDVMKHFDTVLTNIKEL